VGDTVTATPIRHLDVERVSAWISGDLSERDTAVVRAHIEACARCSDVASAFRAQVIAMRGLERPEPPPTLWAAIEGELDKPERRVWSWRATLIGALSGAVAVALAFVAVIGGGGRGFVGLGDLSAERIQGPGRSRIAAQGAESGQEPSAAEGQTPAQISDPLLAEAERELQRAALSYEQAVNRLRKILDREQVLWDPETRARVGERLARLDDAVAHSRAVAQRDPGDSAGADLLFSAYQRQIQFLAEAVRRGSPAGLEGLH
jgi:Putative zinc-finger